MVMQKKVLNGTDFLVDFHHNIPSYLRQVIQIRVA